jgi:hypothetical protein
MNEHAREPTLRRLGVALEASRHRLAALAAAAALAEALQAELVGRFVEAVHRLALAGLPFAREVRYLSGADRPLDGPSLARA